MRKRDHSRAKHALSPSATLRKAPSKGAGNGTEMNITGGNGDRDI